LETMIALDDGAPSELHRKLIASNLRRVLSPPRRVPQRRRPRVGPAAAELGGISRCPRAPHRPQSLRLRTTTSRRYAKVSLRVGDFGWGDD